MNDIGIVKAADNMNDSIHLTNIGKELVSESLALGRTLYQTCDINKFELCGGKFNGVIHLCQLIKTLIGDRYDTDVRFDSAERIVCGFSAGVSQRIEKCTFSDIRKSNHTKLHSNNSPLQLFFVIIIEVKAAHVFSTVEILIVFAAVLALIFQETGSGEYTRSKSAYERYKCYKNKNAR